MIDFKSSKEAYQSHLLQNAGYAIQIEENGLFDTLFVFENYPIDQAALDQFSQFKIKGYRWLEKTEYPLTITVLSDKQIEFLLSYQTKFFDKESSEIIVKHLRHILLTMINMPNKSISEIPKLSEYEYQQVIAQYDQPKMAYPFHQCLHELIEQQVLLTPNAIAVMDSQSNLSYAELNNKANQLAHQIISLQLPSQTRIALIFLGHEKLMFDPCLILT